MDELMIKDTRILIEIGRCQALWDSSIEQYRTPYAKCVVGGRRQGTSHEEQEGCGRESHHRRGGPGWQTFLTGIPSPVLYAEFHTVVVTAGWQILE